MKRTLDGMVIVVTGASSGIGRTTAIELASVGATVVVTARDAVALDEVVRDCEVAGGRAISIPADVTARMSSRPWGGWRSHASAGLMCGSTTPRWRCSRSSRPRRRTFIAG